MGTSGAYSFIETRNDIVRRALLKLKAIDASVTINAQTMNDAVQSLNSMVALWRKAGVHVWKLEEVTIFLDPAQRRYNISLSSTDNIAFAYYQTTSAAAAAAGATSIALSAVTGLTPGDPSASVQVGDQFGVMTATGVISWGVVSAVTGTAVSFAPGLTGQANIGAVCWNYHSATTCAVPRPVGIERGNAGVRRHDFTSLIDTPIGPCLSRHDYDLLPNKNGPGSITQVYFDQQLAQGFVSVWEVPAAPIANLLKLTAQIPIQDFVNPTDNADLPNEWIDPLTWNLAVNLASEFDVPAADYDRLKGEAEEKLATVSTEDREGESLFFQPDLMR